MTVYVHSRKMRHSGEAQLRIETCFEGSETIKRTSSFRWSRKLGALGRITVMRSKLC
jgi:hypothetical protein